MASRFSTPESVQAAVSLLAEHSDVSILAGGTDLMVQLQSGRRTTAHIVDIKRIPELNAVTQAGDGSWS